MDSVLPIFDKELRRPLEIAIKKQKIAVHTKVFAKGIEENKDGSVDLLYTPKDAEEGTEPERLTVDKVLVTVGRRPMSAALHLQVLLSMSEDLSKSTTSVKPT